MTSMNRLQTAFTLLVCGYPLVRATARAAGRARGEAAVSHRVRALLIGVISGAFLGATFAWVASELSNDEDIYDLVGWNRR